MTHDAPRARIPLGVFEIVALLGAGGMGESIARTIRGCGATLR
jgi:uncharacterized membrane protein SpoIIM required for sporulation